MEDETMRTRRKAENVAPMASDEWRDKYNAASAEVDKLFSVLGDALRERDVAFATITALKLRALAAHAALWKAMGGSPVEALAAISDGGEVHEAIHAILAVDTETVTAPDEWRAHVQKQDLRIDWLEAELRRRHPGPSFHAHLVALAMEAYAEARPNTSDRLTSDRTLFEQAAVVRMAHAAAIR